LKGQLAIACDNREQFALDFAKHYLHYGHERSIAELLQRIDPSRRHKFRMSPKSFLLPTNCSY
jgi:hypothetical protein